MKRRILSGIIIVCILCPMALQLQQVIKQKLLQTVLYKDCTALIAAWNACMIPTEEEYHTNEEADVLDLYALSACLTDASTGRILYEKNCHSVRAMASTTKVMTLLCTLELASLDDVVTVSERAAAQPDVQMNIRTGEQYYLRDLLYAMMLESYNDVAVCIAEHVSGSVEAFCAYMTARAKQFGCVQTVFETPNGLDSEGHKTTAAELSLICAHALQNEMLRAIVATQSYRFTDTSGKRTFSVQNKDQFLHMMDGAIGIKTGFTGDAGYCFAGAVTSNGATYVSVVLASGWPPHKSYKWSDTMKLMQYGLETFSPKDRKACISEAIQARDLPSEIAVSGSTTLTVPVDIAESFHSYYPELNTYNKLLLQENEAVTCIYIGCNRVEAPVEENTKIGQLVFSIEDTVIGSMDITVKGAEKVKYSDYYCILLYTLFK